MQIVIHQTFFTAPKPIPYSLEEANALIFARRLSQDTYQVLRNGAKERGADIYPIYNDLLDYRKQFCTPDGIEFNDLEVTVSIKNVLEHQIRRMFDDPMFKERVSVLSSENEAPLEYIIKYGYDAFSQVII